MTKAIRKLNLEYYDRILTEILHLYLTGKTTFENIKKVYRMSVNFYHELGQKYILRHSMQITNQLITNIGGFQGQNWNSEK